MRIDIDKKQAQMIQELLLATGMQPQAVGRAMDLYNKCQAVIDAPDPDDEQRERSLATGDAPIKPLREESHAASQSE